MNAIRLALLTILLGSAAIASGQEMYRWTDENGDLHYSQTKPPAGVQVEKTLYADEQEQYERQMRDLQLQRAQIELQTARQRAGMAANPSPGYAPGYAAQPPVPQSRQAPADMSYQDRKRLDNISRDLSRLSNSSFGDRLNRQQQVDSLMREQEMIYSRNGGQASPRIVIQDQRGGGRW